MRILLIRLSSFGDVLFTTPTIAALCERYPHAQIDFVTYERFGAALRNHPQVNRLLLLPKKTIRNAARSLRLGQSAGRLIGFVSELRQERYDLIVDLHNVTDSALIARLARGTARVGNRRQLLSAGFSHRRPFDDRNESATEHAAISNLRYLVEAGCLPEHLLDRPPRLSFYPGRQAKQNVDRLLAERQLEGRDLVGLNPGGSYQYKRWPAKRFGDVGNHLQEKHGLPLLLFGGPAESDTVAQVQRAVRRPVIDTSRLPLFEAFELISRLRLFVTNDSAPLHVAAAAGTPTIGVYGPANFRKFYPLSDAIQPLLVDVPCRPCTPTQGRACAHRDCFSKLTTHQVCTACDKMLSADSKRRAS